MELRVSEAAAVSIVEQADYYRQASDLALAQRWETAAEQAAHSLLSWQERAILIVQILHGARNLETILDEEL
jgi:plasmid stabilization system protein ParE